MRFKFCGDLDCPDWVLAEINTLSKITSVKMKLLCVQVVKNLLGSQIDYEKVNKLTSDAKFELADTKASISVLSFILSNAAKHSVDGASLANELQQLGLPKEHSSALCKTYADKLEALQDEFRRQCLRLSTLESVEWRVDYILSSSNLKEVNKPSCDLTLKIRDSDTNLLERVSFTMSSDQFRVFLYEMKQAHSKLKSLTTD